MMIPEQKYRYLARLFSKYGEMKRKNHFGGYCLIIDHAIVGLVIDGEFYLRGCLFAQNHFEAIGLKKLIYKKKGVLLELRYYCIPDKVWQYESRFLFYVDLTYQAAMEEQLLKQKVEGRIKDLPNMNMASERALGKVGIYHVEALKLIGAKACYLKLRQYNHYRLGIKLLFELAGAIAGYHSSVLPLDLKQELIRWYHTVDCSCSE